MPYSADGAGLACSSVYLRLASDRDISDEATPYACTCCCVQESPALSSGAPSILHIL